MAEDTPTVSMIGSLSPWKGISPYCESLLEGLQENDVEVEFFNWRSLYPSWAYPGGDPKKSNEYYEGPNVRTVLRWWNPITWIYVGLTAKGNIFHAQWWSWFLAPAYLTILSLARIQKKNIVLTIHNVEPHEQSFWKHWLNRSVYHLADRFIVHSEENKASFIEQINVPEEHVHVIPHPPLLVPETGITQTEARDQLGITARHIVLFFGNIRDYKGLDVLLEQFPQVIDDLEDILLLVVGKPWEDWEQYEHIIDNHELGDYITTVLEYVPDEEVELYFKAADLVVLPYKHFDAQSGVPMLAKQFNTPTLGTDVGGLAEQADYVVSSEDIAAFIVDQLRYPVALSQSDSDAFHAVSRLYTSLLR